MGVMINEQLEKLKNDLINFSLNDVSKKWNISFYEIKKIVSLYNLETMNGKNGERKHRIIDGIEYKRCGSCKEWYICDKNNFYISKNKKDGFQSNCKKCQNIKDSASRNKLSDWWDEGKIDDLKIMGDKDFSNKWNVSRKFIIGQRKLLNLKSYNNQYGIIEHEVINDIEYKRCSSCLEWKILTEFNNKRDNRDGLDNYCRNCSIEYSKSLYIKNNGREYAKTWRKNNPESVYISRHKTQINVKNAYVYWSLKEENYISNIFNNKCAWCESDKKLELEHFIPISKGGNTQPGNCYLCCEKCNRGINGKFNHMPLDWAKRVFGDLDGQRKYNIIKEKLFIHYQNWYNNEND